MFILTKFILQIKLIYYGIPNNLKQFIKKTFTNLKAFDTCERHRNYFELIFERFGGVVWAERRYKLMNNRFNVLSS
jgi:hypothetical protein